ncbi:MAG: hypothetical protein M1830_002962 [Pleopsidium flavum]|nr:MAG: hypothetical protein M1830_002962 [Pleopsidium flavum]
MTVQAINAAPDLGPNQFSLAIPGGGIGATNSCSEQYGVSPSNWGQQYGGISSAPGCDSFPAAIKAGCDWRFDWFGGADNPTVDFVQVPYPAALTNKTGYVRHDEPASPLPPSSGLNTSSKVAIGVMLPTVGGILAGLWSLTRLISQRQRRFLSDQTNGYFHIRLSAGWEFTHRGNAKVSELLRGGLWNCWDDG